MVVSPEEPLTMTMSFIIQQIDLGICVIVNQFSRQLIDIV